MTKQMIRRGMEDDKDGKTRTKTYEDENREQRW